MSSYLDNKVIESEWCDENRNYVLKKERIRTTKAISRRSVRFHFENLSGEYKDGDEFEIGLSKESWAVTKGDKPFFKSEERINKGVPVSVWWSATVDLTIDDLEEYWDEEEEED